MPPTRKRDYWVCLRLQPLQAPRARFTVCDFCNKNILVPGALPEEFWLTVSGGQVSRIFHARCAKGLERDPVVDESDLPPGIVSQVQSRWEIRPRAT